jgi:hypothetical protein
MEGPRSAYLFWSFATFHSLETEWTVPRVLGFVGF